MRPLLYNVVIKLCWCPPNSVLCISNNISDTISISSDVIRMRLLLQCGRIFQRVEQSITFKTFNRPTIVRNYCEKIDRPASLNQHKSTKIDKKKAVGPISWFNLGASGVIIGVLMGFYYYARGLKEEALQKERKKAIGKARIGGRFELIDHNGKECKSEDFLGKWVYLYFGFTHCPDICPEEMEKIAEAVSWLSHHWQRLS